VPSISAMKTIGALAGGGLLAGYAGWRSSGRNPNMDTEDRLAFTGSSVIAGAAAGLALRGIGMRGLGAMAKAGGKAARMGYKAASFSPVERMLGKTTARKLGIGAGFGAYKGHGGTVGLLALMAAGVGATAYNARKNPQPIARASREDAGMAEVGPMPRNNGMRERAGLLGATGDMVFGLNNMRHG